MKDSRALILINSKNNLVKMLYLGLIKDSYKGKINRIRHKILERVNYLSSMINNYRQCSNYIPIFKNYNNK